MRRRKFLFNTALSAAALGGLAGVVGVPTTARAATQRAATHPGSTDIFPPTFALPDGFQPEGIAIGKDPIAYFGSRLDGSIYQASLVTGRGRILSAGPGTPSLGLKVDAHHIFVSGGSGGDARVINWRTGNVLASYQFSTGPSFVNDVVLTDDAAWFTDSTNLVLYGLPLRNRRLPSAAEVIQLPLTGDIIAGDGINANGIARTPDRRALLIVQSSTGKLFRVDPRNGVTREVDLGGEVLTNGDGLLRHGPRTLYAVQNRLNRVAVLRLNDEATKATVVTHVTDERFDVPTTVADYRDWLYLPNARFTTPPGPTTPYSVVAIPRP
ncbi:hypothetical protein [Actinopolymorpha alba]|uniref:hypothetical protein n=1 Tax=Actinopolymorpha alba TaxID=533267 RepID=UPI000379BC2C|nr:hypothetical protein [Actinopolymorpha alba]